MAAMSDYLEEAIINEILRGVDYVPPSSVHLALFTADPTDADTGTEVSGTGYARQAITFAAPVDGVCGITTEIAFPAAGVSWGLVTHIGVIDASTSGNLLFHGALTVSKQVDANDVFRVAVGDFSITLA